MIPGPMHMFICLCPSYSGIRKIKSKKLLQTPEFYEMLVQTVIHLRIHVKK